MLCFPLSLDAVFPNLGPAEWNSDDLGNHLGSHHDWSSSLKEKERKKMKYTLHLCPKLENVMMNIRTGMLTRGKFDKINNSEVNVRAVPLNTYLLILTTLSCNNIIYLCLNNIHTCYACFNLSWFFHFTHYHPHFSHFEDKWLWPLSSSLFSCLD
jgi:hypothetical protein